MLVSRAVASVLTVCAIATPCLTMAANHFVSDDGTWKMKDKSGQEMEGRCHTTIQAAASAAVNEDVIWVKNDVVCNSGGGTNGRVTNNAKTLVFRGEDDDPSNGPVIDGMYEMRCVYLNKDSQFIGFTVRNGYVSAGVAGGIYIGSVSTVVSNCIVHGCLAEGHGGGVYSNPAGGKVCNCDIFQNETSGSNEKGCNGGGAYAAALYDSRIVSNRCFKATGTLSGTGGGGLALGSATRCLIAGNTAGKSGFGSTGGGTYNVQLFGCLITNNYSYSNAGGVNGGSLIDSTNMFNYATGRGGGCFETLVASNSLVACNTAAGSGGGGGVGFQNAQLATALWYNCIISNNTAATATGGGVTTTKSGDTFEHCLITCNTAPASNDGGGGVYSGTFLDCCIVSNAALKGGGVAAARCYDCLISNNVVTSSKKHTDAHGHGGGASGSSLYGCRIVGNRADYNGGGATGGVVSNCTVICNDSALKGSMSGGALNSAKVYDTLIANNVSHGESGGGCKDCDTWNCVIVSNVNEAVTVSSAGRGGGGVLGGTHYNALIAGNISGSQGSGASIATLCNCTVVGNVGMTSGGDTVIGGYSTTPSYLVNTIIWGNKNASGSPAGLVCVDAVSNCCVEVASVPATWVACTNVNPRFENAAAGDYTPRARACRDVALEFDWMKDASDIRSKDLAGRDRVIGKGPDMGAFEARIKGLLMMVQ